MALPTIFPPKYVGDSFPWLHAKVQRDGSMDMAVDIVSVPSGTTVNTLVGLIPFQAGFRLDYASILNTGALGTSVTVALGYVYKDNTTLVDAPTAFLAANTVAAAGGYIPLATAGAIAGAGFVSGGDGWIVAQILGATTGSTGSITFQLKFAYDS